MTQSKAASDYARKLAAAHAQAQAAGLKRWDYDTLADRLLRKLGFRAPPTLYAPLGWLAVCFAVYFAVFMALMGHFLIWKHHFALEFFLLLCGLGGVAFGAMMAVYQRFYRRKHKLTPWSEL
jgi:hypothetical protein